MATLSSPRRDDRDMIPKGLLWAMLALVLASLALVSFSVLTDREHAGTPPTSTVLEETWLILEGQSAQAVTVRDKDGKLIADLPHGGFITVIQNAMTRARTVAGVTGNPPMKVVRYANGRLTAYDPASGWSAELYAFGNDNKAAFERLLASQK
ncbi:photosynthetic complex assembly protein PuhC [Stagnihabitans tardus]|uniref:Photosynthetic complex assembly protein n=1 Tax=Stagnihabitans tardus TaxID=2699202 RepID=A0AAE5BT87_9RHOB|nr:photosynthetic complex assembly protein PuhC [Stagnihabitans tardus]NBZ86391.1 photosynthetic complex assembly protein [Stagnihabitans tardus]